MKQILLTIVIGLALGTVSLAQSTAPAPPASGQSAAPQQQPQSQQPSAGQQPAAPSQSNPQQQPPAQQPPAAGQPAAPSAGAQQPAAPTGPQAKSKEEFDAYMAAVNEPDPAKAEVAIIAFEQKFPDSQLRAPLYQQLMGKYQQANNADKTIEAGRKAIQLAPDSPVALITVASVIAERTRPTDLDSAEKFAEGKKNAERAIQLIETRAWAPPQLTPQQLDAVKSMAYVAIGAMELNRGNDAPAEQALRRAIELNMLQPEAVTYLRLALALDRQKKYADALVVANRAVELAANDPAVREKAVQEQNRLKQLTGGTIPPAGTPNAKGTGAAPPQQPRQQPPR